MTATIYTQWKVGDKINICGSVTEFCGVEYQLIIPKDINITKSPTDCFLDSGTGGSCGLHIDNIELTFSIVKGSPVNNCVVAQTYKTLGSVRTNSDGAAGLSYTVTEQDRLNYISATNEGYFYYVMTCITNSDGQSVSEAKSIITNPILISESEVTHNLDLTLIPWSWYSPGGAVDAITQKIIDINGAITNFFANYGIIDYTYIGTEVFTETDKVIIRIKLNKINTVTMGVPLLVQIAVLITTILFIISFIGRISSYVFDVDNIALTNEELTSAGQEFMKNLTNDCETKTCSDPTLTQDQKVTCIKNCVDSALTRWKEYQTDIYPDADHTALDNGLTEIQLCYNTYNSSSKTLTDYQTLLDCIKIKREKAIDEDKAATLETYDPDATAGEKEASSDLGKILLYGGVGLAGLYVLTRKK